MVVACYCFCVLARAAAARPFQRVPRAQQTACNLVLVLARILGDHSVLERHSIGPNAKSRAIVFVCKHARTGITAKQGRAVGDSAWVPTSHKTA
jgi:hypothetical protein